MNEIFSELDTILCFMEAERELFDLLLLLETFDEYGWQGCHQVGGWSIVKGSYDLWFQLSYQDVPVIECVDHYLCVVNDNGCDADAALRVLKERYSYMEISKEDRKGAYEDEETDIEENGGDFSGEMEPGDLL